MSDYELCPLGELADYSLRTLQELADRHLERADELRRKFDQVIERHEAIVNAIEKKTVNKKNTVSHIRQLLSEFPDEARADIFSVVKLENGDADDVQVHEWCSGNLTPWGPALRLLAKSEPWRDEGPVVKQTVGTIRFALAQMDDDDLVTIGFSSDYGEDCPIVDFHAGWPIDDGADPFVCLEIVRITIGETTLNQALYNLPEYGVTPSDYAADSSFLIHLDEFEEGKNISLAEFLYDNSSATDAEPLEADEIQAIRDLDVGESVELAPSMCALVATRVYPVLHFTPAPTTDEEMESAALTIGSIQTIHHGEWDNDTIVNDFTLHSAVIATIEDETIQWALRSDGYGYCSGEGDDVRLALPQWSGEVNITRVESPAADEYETCEICGNAVSFDDAECLEVVEDLMQAPVHAACMALSPEECLKRFQLRFVGVKMESAQALVHGALLARNA